jgi:hypothetical protein
MWGSGTINEDKDTTRFRMHILVDRPRASDSRPSGPYSASSVDEVALKNEQELWTLVRVTWKPRPRFKSYGSASPSRP